MITKILGRRSSKQPKPFVIMNRAAAGAGMGRSASAIVFYSLIL